MPGASDDVEIVYEPDPKDPTNKIVLLVNNNRNKTVAANFRVEGSKPVAVLTLDRIHANLFPHEFKVVVEAGARQLIGRVRLDRLTSVEPRVTEQISISYKVQGAVYVEDEPQPPPQSEVSRYLVFYEVDIAPKLTGDELRQEKKDKGQTLIYAINTNHQFRLQAFIVSKNTTNEWFSPDLGVFECRLSHSCYDLSIRRGWSVQNGKFVPEYPPFA
ncbi:hypothetical protein AGRHK599_LOCUS1214 [Rhizobium rhizogenes]|uniref:Uncharacterized protein n=1 Tax=Rhizobium rhizogenes TaxID=359 RepID=A0AAN2DCF0_RHIRH|nr:MULTISPECIES: hypothetical protein [Rhizobium/Agrobacterium group]AQS61782.1 hypothetical protein B0909_05610 [Rhizobium rhizogenes]MCZ7442988.1 hypothetical protein [Rhizobium rhizogenes]NSZ78975.1 hypothetical protein [Agrobacterium tumefaciens]OAM65771.1 hypothetical protein A8L48_22515 [Rhizobium rhizogenes]CAD0211189.1 hypothetical protein AGRHK599_LOCUS1214 [Rhizobium rhizogenes]